MPSTHLTGYLYSELGYTTVMQASAAPLAARHTHEELEDVPNLDKGAFIVMGNNHFVMQCIADKQPEKARDYVAWLLRSQPGLRHQGRESRRRRELEVGQERRRARR